MSWRGYGPVVFANLLLWLLVLIAAAAAPAHGW